MLSSMMGSGTVAPTRETLCADARFSEEGVNGQALLKLTGDVLRFLWKLLVKTPKTEEPGDENK